VLDATSAGVMLATPRGDLQVLASSSDTMRVLELSPTSRRLPSSSTVTRVDAQALDNQLTEALNSRVIIEQAKGRVSEADHLDMDQAFRRLPSHARNHNLRSTDLCRSIADRSMAPRSLDPLPTKRTR